MYVCLLLCWPLDQIDPWVKMETENRVLTLIGIFYSFDLTQLAMIVVLAEALHFASIVEKYSRHHRSQHALKYKLTLGKALRTLILQIQSCYFCPLYPTHYPIYKRPQTS